MGREKFYKSEAICELITPFSPIEFCTNRDKAHARALYGSNHCRKHSTFDAITVPQANGYVGHLIVYACSGSSIPGHPNDTWEQLVISKEQKSMEDAYRQLLLEVQVKLNGKKSESTDAEVSGSL
jgi:hypothetical protein